MVATALTVVDIISIWFDFNLIYWLDELRY